MGATGGETGSCTRLSLPVGSRAGVRLARADSFSEVGARRDEMCVELVVGRYRPDRDGVSAYVERLAAALPALGVQVTVTEWPGVRRFEPRPDADLVHVQFAPSAYGYSGGIGLLPLRTRQPIVTTLHEYDWW